MDGIFSFLKAVHFYPFCFFFFSLGFLVFEEKMKGQFKFGSTAIHSSQIVKQGGIMMVSFEA